MDSVLVAPMRRNGSVAEAYAIRLSNSMSGIPPGTVSGSGGFGKNMHELDDMDGDGH